MHYIFEQANPWHKVSLTLLVSFNVPYTSKNLNIEELTITETIAIKKFN